MSEIKRKLASIQKISKLKPHPNADTLEIAEVLGWDCIVKKDEHKVDELILYFEIDSFLPVLPVFEFLRRSYFKSTQNLGDGFRLRTAKLRGEVSQGLVLPLKEFTLPSHIEEGMDLTDYLHVKKYEAPIPANLQGIVKGGFPSFILKTDQERFQNLSYRELNRYNDDVFEVTKKLDGSSMTVYWNDGIFGVCSRNFELELSEDNTFWQIAIALKLEEIFERYFPNWNIAIQGELVGPGIQHNRGKERQHELYVFDIYDIDERRYFSPPERVYFMREFMSYSQLKHVPTIASYCHGIPSKEVGMKLAENTYLKNDEPCEGIVFKSINNPQFSFKIISNKYILANEE
jgi:RNA ligase (TIGR02306 family)